MDLGGARRVLDQLHQPIAQHHLARRHRHIASNLEILHARRRPLGPPALDVVQQIAQAAPQVGAALLQGPAQGHRVGCQLVSGGKHVQPLAGGKGHHGLMMPLHPEHPACGRFPPALVQQEGLVPQVERPVAPFRRGEAAVAGGRFDAGPGPTRPGAHALAQVVGQGGGLFQRQCGQFGLLARADGQVSHPIHPGQQGRLRRQRSGGSGQGGPRLHIQ